MSYRTIKRLLGETSLERKCRLLLGGGIFLLIAGSFFFYSHLTENLIWQQLEQTAQLKANQILLHRHGLPGGLLATDGMGNVADYPLPDDLNANRPTRTSRPRHPNKHKSTPAQSPLPLPLPSSPMPPTTDTNDPVDQNPGGAQPTATPTQTTAPPLIPVPPAPTTVTTETTVSPTRAQTPASAPAAHSLATSPTPEVAQQALGTTEPSNPSLPPIKTPSGTKDAEWNSPTELSGDSFQSMQAEIEKLLPEYLRRTQGKYFRPSSHGQLPLIYRPSSHWESDALRSLERGDAKQIAHLNREGADASYQYMQGVYLAESCARCHPTAQDRSLGVEKMEMGELMGAISVTMPMHQAYQLAINVNRALLLSVAVFTALAAMIWSYITIRYVIVKPVTHLKEVSDEIASGNLAIRANLQSQDEFQELSLAFNRMIRNLISMQDKLRQVNTDLDARLDELARANLALYEANRMKSDFLANISHELRTPLNSILGFSDLLAELKQIENKPRRWVQNIQTSGKLLLGLINDILDLAKLEAGKMQVHVDEFALRDLVESQIQMLLPLAQKKNIAIAVEFQGTIPRLQQDAPKIGQILNNLLSNAIKFTPEGGQIIVDCRTDRGHVVLSVIDNGVGIAPEDQKLIFEKFRQAESSLVRVHGGTGLGLSIVRELTKLLGGDEVELHSELGRGSTFTVRLPICYVEPTNKDLTITGNGYEMVTLNQDIRFYSSSRDRTPAANDLKPRE